MGTILFPSPSSSFLDGDNELLDFSADVVMESNHFINCQIPEGNKCLGIHLLNVCHGFVL